jgi:hypothetical protein
MKLLPSPSRNKTGARYSSGFEILCNILSPIHCFKVSGFALEPALRGVSIYPGLRELTLIVKPPS